MKRFKMPFTDRFGNDLYERCIFKYTKHSGLSLPDFEGRIVWIESIAAFGYELNIISPPLPIPFANFKDLKNDFLRHIEKIIQ